MLADRLLLRFDQLCLLNLQCYPELWPRRSDLAPRPCTEFTKDEFRCTFTIKKKTARLLPNLQSLQIVDKSLLTLATRLLVFSIV